MALGPRLEFRQTQSLVMTPQLRQAIKLLQFSNQEVTAFVEQELERNPLLERDEVSERVTVEIAAPDQRPERAAGEPDAADQAHAGTLPEQGADPLDVGELAERYDAGGPSDGGPGALAGSMDVAARTISTRRGGTCRRWRRTRRPCASSWASSSD